MQLPEADPGIQVSERAKKHILESLAQSNASAAVGIRIGVKKAGCSGYEYVLEYAYSHSITDMDFCFKFESVQVVIDKEIYLKFLKGGTVLNYGQEGLNEGFKFDNPNVANQCGCGESFTLK